MPTDIPAEISKLIDGWCGRRALRPLRTILPVWPPPNGFTDEWHHVWAAMRHLRAMCRDDLAAHGESDSVNQIVAELSGRLFPVDGAQDIEAMAEGLIASIFGAQQSGGGAPD